jgi:hypothetical protein
LSDQSEGYGFGLFVITREGVVKQLATINGQTFQVEFSDDVNLTPTERDKAIQDLLFDVSNRPAVKKIEADSYVRYDSTKLNDFEQQIGQFLFDTDLLGGDEFIDNYYPRRITAINKRIPCKVEDFLTYPDPERSLFPDVRPLVLALNRLKKDRSRIGYY